MTIQLLTFHRSRRFKQDYKMLPDEIKKAFKKQMQYLLSNPTHPSLNLKKMKDPRSIWRCKLTGGYRFTFQIQENCCILRRIGPHDIERKP